ncbi:restriction endonuclease subunit S [Streptomyces sp. ISL-99]|uniref:restriction endonuclease subunit S n=1 Tax=Streptomyces sp. ISL-99 TaxID=2819193 RepID=UPI001BE8BFED|nr:restriction endonuclease subunit S [Streptomyces sp. ISL-99]MBT2526001.1 restriction endonuclease subunit S [Streptomyces sp. ISL-99]
MNDLTTLWRMAKYENGFAFKPGHFSTTGLPVVRIRQLINPAADMDRCEGPVPPRYRIESGDLIFSWSGSLAVRIWNRGPAWLNQHLFKVIPNPGVEKKWLQWVLQASIPRFEGLMHGSAMTHLNLDMLKLLKYQLPEAAEQRRITEFLDAETARIDSLMHARKLQQRLLAERRVALRNDCVTFDGPRKIRHPLLGYIHPDWKVQPLRRALPAINVGVVINPSHFFTDSGVPFLHGFNVREGWINPVGLKFMSPESNDLHKRSKVFAGDVLVVRAGATAGRSAKVGEEFDGTNCASVLILRKSNTLDSAFLETFINSVAGKGQVSFSQYGAAQEVISAGQVSSFLIALPSLVEQRARVAELNVATAGTVDLESRLTRQVDLLAERRQALITAAVTGQFDVSTASGRNVTDGVSA